MTPDEISRDGVRRGAPRPRVMKTAALSAYNPCACGDTRYGASSNAATGEGCLATTLEQILRGPGTGNTALRGAAAAG